MQSTSQEPDDEDESDAHSYYHSYLLPFDPKELARITTNVERSSSGSSGPRTYNQYVRGEKIGKGKHGDVYVCRDQEIGGYELAMKIVRKSNNRDRIKLLRRTYQQENLNGQPALNSTMNSIRREIALMQKFRHANVVRLVEVLDDLKDDKIYIVMEYLSGGPVEWCDNESRPILKLQQTRRIMRDTILGLEYLHHEGIIHRDIKPANILYTSDRRSVKIIDFGVAHFIPPQTPPPSKTIKGKQPSQPEPVAYKIDPSLFPESDIRKRAGTPSFLAPEVVWFSDDGPNLSPSLSYDTILEGMDDNAGFQKPKQRPPVTKSIDVWSLGVTFYCLLFGHTPFTVPSSPNENMQRSEFVLYNIICTKDWPVDASMGADSVATGGKRPTESDSEGYSVVQLLGQMLQKDPQNRTSLQEIKVQANSWILKDVENPREWLQATSPSRDYEDVKTPSSWVKSASKKILRLIPRKG
ncbi:hypothetical protein CVT25_003010 [Psilocybe cyanescens]|uniref:Protein kinase domain-containing protein n=1 Tax=Psilocybe cyanescens TaxID=93625 RepID=A0A409WN52_PSICY|nr:hypothetical protein CVT25_003010 [Psilocybe cyanescens]